MKKTRRLLAVLMSVVLMLGTLPGIATAEEVQQEPVAEQIIVSASISPAEAALDQQVSLSASVTGATGTLAYQWEWATLAGDGAWNEAPDATGPQTSFTVSEATLARRWRARIVHTVAADAETGVEASETTYYSNEVRVTEKVQNPVPVVSIVRAPDGAVQIGTQVTLTAAVESGDASAYTWKWSITGDAATLSDTSGASVTLDAVAKGEATIALEAEGVEGAAATTIVEVTEKATDNVAPVEEEKPLITEDEQKKEENKDNSSVLFVDDTENVSNVDNSVEEQTAGQADGNAEGGLKIVLPGEQEEEEKEEKQEEQKEPEEEAEVEMPLQRGARLSWSFSMDSTSLTVDGATGTLTLSPNRPVDSKISSTEHVSLSQPSDTSWTVTPLSVGTATVTLTDENGATLASIDIAVVAPTITIKGEGSRLGLVRQTITLEADGVPAGQEGKLSWSADEGVTLAPSGTKVNVSSTSSQSSKKVELRYNNELAGSVQVTFYDITAVAGAGAMKVGELGTYAVRVTPPMADESQIIWSVDNDALTVVRSTGAMGEVKGAKEGQATLTAKYGEETVATYSIKVTAPEITVDADKTTLNTGDKTTLSVALEDYDSITWSSAASAITLSPTTGDSVVATAAGPESGPVEVTMTAEVNGVTYTKKVTINIVSASINIESRALSVGEAFTLSGVNVSDPTKLTWETSDAAVAAVSYPVAGDDLSARVEGMALGTATITMKYNGIAVGSCAVEVVGVTATSIRIEAPRTALYHRDGTPDTQQLTVIAQPNDTQLSVNWESSNTAVATISATGEMTTVDRGTTRITATTKDGLKKATISITVNALAGSVEITNKPTGGTVDLVANKTFIARATVMPANASNRTVQWVVDPASSAVTVSASGMIRANAVSSPQTVKVWALPADSVGLSLADRQALGNFVTVNVWPTPSRVVIYDSSDALTTSLAMGMGDTPQTLHADVLPMSVNQTVTWKTSNPNVVSITVNADGTCTVTPSARYTGKANITATSADGSQSATVAVTVASLVQSIAVTGPNTVGVGKAVTLKATLTPANATYRTVTWASENPGIATVSGGVVRGVSVGTTDIVVTSSDGNAVARHTIEVQPVATGMSIVDYPGGDIITTLAMDHAADANGVDVSVVMRPAGLVPDVKWTTSNARVASIVTSTDASGNPVCTIIPQGSGTVTITAAAQDGSNQRATLRVTVGSLATSVTVTPATASVAMGRTVKLTATVVPSYATNQRVVWVSEDERIATVSSTGVVTGVMPGKVFIYAKSADGAVTGEDGKEGVPGNYAEVTVTPMATRVTILQGGEVVTSAFLGTDELAGLQLTAEVFPTDFNNSGEGVSQDVEWTTSNRNVATVDANGLVLPVRAGTVTITARTTDGSNISATCRVTVGTQAAGIAISAPQSTIVGGSTLRMTATMLPVGTSVTSQQLTWEVLDAPYSETISPYATITSGGVLTAARVDSKQIVYVSARFFDGFSWIHASAPFPVTILPTTASIAFEEEQTDGTWVSVRSVTIDIATLPDKDVRAVVYPTDAGETLTWRSSNESVAQIIAIDGPEITIRGRAAGTATITATTTDGTRISGSFTVRVSTLASAITDVNNPPQLDVDLLVGRTKQLVVAATPANAVNSDVLWTSDNPSIAQVNRLTGMVTAITPGTAHITATLKDASKEDLEDDEDYKERATVTYTINVYAQPKAVILGGANPVRLTAGDSTMLSAAATPSDAHQLFTAVSSNPNVAMVSPDSGTTFTITAAPMAANKTTVVTIASKDNPSVYMRVVVVVE